jgi:peptidoglycan-associated lipoprotein
MRFTEGTVRWRQFGLFMVVSCMVFLAIDGGCSKKVVKVSVPEPTPVVLPETPVAAPPAPPAVDSAAIIAAQMRDALQNVYFDLDKVYLRQDALDRLRIIGKALMDHRKVVISIEGHCDERGSSEYNIGLGENRAKAVKSWLVAYGIADSRMSTTSYGKERPAAYGCTDDPCHQKNRRCEFKMAGW